MSLSEEQRQFYEANGYLYPLPVFSDNETAEFRQQFDEYTDQNRDRLSKLIPRERRAVYGLTHLLLPWVYQIVSHPRVLEAVEGAIGPNLLVWGSDWFVKFPGDAAFISWHQDGAYWGLQPPKVTTAWIALSPSTLESGCMQVMPGTQKTQLPQRETYALDNALSRGQEIEFDVDESKAVALQLAPGEMSLHHIGIAHGSRQTAPTMRASALRSATSRQRLCSKAASGKSYNWCVAKTSLETSKSLPRRLTSSARQKSERKPIEEC